MNLSLLTVVMGPTAIGKTDFAFDLAVQQGAEIVSADAFQIYRGMEIGTAQPSVDMQQNVVHHCIGHVDPLQPYTVFDFQHHARGILERRLAAGQPTIVCGGNGLYINSLLFNYTFSEETWDHTYRQALEKRIVLEGLPALVQELFAIDPDAQSYIDPHNARRVIRALEIFHFTGEKPSLFRQKTNHMLFPATLIGLTTERNLLIDRINQRVDHMFEMGLLEEFEQLLNRGLTASHPAMQAVGYKELFLLKNGTPLDKVIELVKIHTRQYAKRQMTWFKRLEHVHWKTLHL